MATFPSTYGKVTLLDIARATDPNGRIASVAELLSQSNEILLDMPWFEGNLPTGHKGSIRTGLPEPVWRKLYQGVAPTKSLRATVEDSCGMLEDRSEVDVDAVNLNGNSDAFRLSEAQAHLEGMNQTMAEALIYGDATLHPERFNGLAVRYNSLTGTVGAQNVIDAHAGTASGADHTSIWLVVWGQNTVHGIYPKGSQAGLSHQDLGEESLTDGSGNWYQAARTLYQWKAGLVVKDWRYVVRIANIDVSNLVSESSNADLIKLMTKALYRIPNLRMGRPAFYVNRTVHEMLAIQALNKSQQVLRINEATTQYGTPHSWTSFLGVPIRCCDQILNSEARIT